MIAVVFRNGVCRFLKPGFQHCFLVLLSPAPAPTSATVVEKLLLRLRPQVTADTATLPQLFANYSQRGYTVVLLQRDPLPVPAAPLTCTALAKAVLGIRDPRVLTPYQLYKRITCWSRRTSRTP